MKRPRLGDESAFARGRNHELLEGDESGRDNDIGKEHAGTVEEAQLAKLHGNWHATHFTQPGDETFVLLRRGLAQELQRDVP